VFVEPVPGTPVATSDIVNLKRTSLLRTLRRLTDIAVVSVVLAAPVATSAAQNARTYAMIRTKRRRVNRTGKMTPK